ncbi:MFS transporter [Halanaerobaculum tunisiense]
MESQVVKEDTPLSKKEYFAYFSYGFGQCLSFGLVSTFLMYFYTDILGISALAGSTIFFVARAWDAVNDPMVASFMDTRRTKEGKFKGYLKYVPILILISTILCFISPDISQLGKIIYAGLSYILWGTLYTMSDIPFWSLSAVMTKKSEERTRLVTGANLGVFAGMGMASVILPPLVDTLGQGNSYRGYLYAVVTIMLLAYLFMLYGYKHITERVEPTKESRKITLKDVFETLKSNKYMFKILSIFGLNIFMNIVQNIINYFFIYNMGNPNLMSIFGIIGTGSALGFFLIPPLTEKYSKKSVLSAILIFDIVLRVVFFSVGYESTIFIMIMVAITQFLYAATAPIISAMLAETIEYSEVKTGNRCEAIVFCGQTFIGKLSVALAGGSTGIILSIIGYVPDTAQTSETLLGLFVAISILPAVGSLLRFIILSTYEYTEEDFRKNLEILEKRKSKEKSI